MRIWGLVAVLLAFALSSTVAAGTNPALRVRTLTPFSVRGTQFKASERVTVTLDGVWVRHVKANPTGAFAATFRGVDVNRCDGYRVTAVGSKSSRAALRVRALMCGSINPG
jgi:hypothetical protein